ncbi:hypothetical protein GCM10025880_63340 [Methylorubrum aminovorans]|nr:hypothetical protein GCM10025880_63340 [Methylorubrum aminovorans]
MGESVRVRFPYDEARGQGDQEPDWLTDLRAHEATSQMRLANRILMLVALRPAVGAIVRLNAKARVIEGYGCSFVVDANTESVWGPHFRGQEGQPCCYAYTRAAMSRETVVLEVQEAAREAERIRLLHIGRARSVGRGYAVAHPHPSAHRHQS